MTLNDLKSHCETNGYIIHVLYNSSHTSKFTPHRTNDIVQVYLRCFKDNNTPKLIILLNEFVRYRESF